MEFLTWILDAKKKFCHYWKSKRNCLPRGISSNSKKTKSGLVSLLKEMSAFSEAHIKIFAVASDHKEGLIRVSGVFWFTNIDLGRRHQNIQLMTMADNLKFSKHEDIKKVGYLKYDNYDAIEVPFSDAIPSDYDGVFRRSAYLYGQI
jgi:hypothetical protein